mgnify:CR=1
MGTSEQELFLYPLILLEIALDSLKLFVKHDLLMTQNAHQDAGQFQNTIFLPPDNPPLLHL